MHPERLEIAPLTSFSGYQQCYGDDNDNMICFPYGLCQPILIHTFCRGKGE
jgi:hypothetical protein